MDWEGQIKNSWYICNMKERSQGWGKRYETQVSFGRDKVKALVTRKDQVFCFLLEALGGHTFLVLPTPEVRVPLSGFLLFHT